MEDTAAYVESVGEPVGLVGPSGGAIAAPGAAARASAVAAVAVYEPIVFEALDEEDAARLRDAIGRMSELAGEGRLADAARGWMEHYADDREMAALAASGWLETSARYVPVLLRTLEQAARSEGPGPTDPSVLEKITVPVLILQGARTTRRWFRAGVSHVAEHVADAEVRQVAGAGHMGVWVEPEAIAA